VAEEALSKHPTYALLFATMVIYVPNHLFVKAKIVFLCQKRTTRLKHE